MKNICALAVAVSLLSMTAIPVAMSQTEIANWDYADLRDDLYLTELLGNNVESEDNQSIGTVRDVTIGADGNFDAVVVSFDRADADATALMLMEWSDTVMAPGDDALTVSIGTATGDDGAPVSDDEKQGGVQGRRLIGMPVHLKDAKHFGEVADVLVDPATRQPSALLIKTAAETIALPLEPEAIHADSGNVIYDYSRAQALAAGEFDVRVRGDAE